jgi:hypothetical protein
MSHCQEYYALYDPKMDRWLGNDDIARMFVGNARLFREISTAEKAQHWRKNKRFTQIKRVTVEVHDL